MSIPHTIQHFTHNHPLTQVNGIGTYTCDGCKLYGEARTYRCSDCDYDLHEYCATCPSSLVNSCHGPDHELSLFNGHMTERSCYVCLVSIQGMFYKCRQCSFESHPLCTYVPMHHASSPDVSATKQRSLHGHAGQPSTPHQYGQGIPYGYPHMGHPEPYPPQGGYQHQYQNQNQNHHPYMNPGTQKTEFMGQPEPYPPQGGGHQHQHQNQNHQPGPYPPQGDGHQHQHQQQNHYPYMNSGSPKAESSPKSSTTKTKKKKPGGFFGAMKAAATATVTLAAQVAVATMTDGETTYE